MKSLPAEPGTYALILRLSRPEILQVGRLGKFLFPDGNYVYLGSAFGPGGLRARLGRHLQGAGRPHWHIDSLRTVARVEGFIYALARERLECRWSRLLSGRPGARIPVAGFGAGDCRGEPLRCPAHLIAFPSGLDTAELDRLLTAACDTT
jgi:Uri superfamily endonuclease